jgi:hypothetical protein
MLSGWWVFLFINFRIKSNRKISKLHGIMIFAGHNYPFGDAGSRSAQQCSIIKLIYTTVLKMDRLPIELPTPTIHLLMMLPQLQQARSM